MRVIVPVYNTEKYLAECIDLLMEQNIPHNDYEIICANDGSTDGSYAPISVLLNVRISVRIRPQELILWENCLTNSTLICTVLGVSAVCSCYSV